MKKKYIVFWKVKGGEPREVYRGSDIIELDGEVSLEMLDELASDCVTASIPGRWFENLSGAVNDACLTICNDWKILRFKELKETKKQKKKEKGEK